jgi:hypothetical protein
MEIGGQHSRSITAVVNPVQRLAAEIYFFEVADF